MVALLQLSETDKRTLFALLLVFILLFVLIGYIGMLTVKIMKYQGKQLDDYVAKPVMLKIITDKKKFKKYAYKKNWILFYKQARIPILILMAAGLVLLLRNIIVKDFSYNPFHQVTNAGMDEYGNQILHYESFSSLLFLWKWDISIGNAGISIPWPELIHSPEFVPSAIASYIFVIGLLVGGIWYLVVVQAFIARLLRINKLGNSMFSHSLENYNQTQDIASQMTMQKAQELQQNKENESK